MCISVPAKVIEYNSNTAIVEVDGGLRRIVLIAPDLPKSAWVLIHGGIAVATLTDEEAGEMQMLVRRATTAGAD